MTVTTPSDLSRRVRVLIGQVVVKVALFATFAGFISVLLPTRIADIDPDGKVPTLAMITTIGFIMNAVAQPAVGALSDRTRSRFGRRLPWMAAGAVLGGLAIGAIGDVQTVLLLTLLWAVAQVALHGLEIAMDAYLVDAFAPSRRGVAAGVTGLALVAGTATGAILSSSLVARPSVASWLFAGMIAASVIVFAILVRDPPTTAAEVPRRPFTDTVRAAAAAVAAHPDFVRVLAWRVGYSIAYSSVFAYQLYILTDLIGIPELPAARQVALAVVLGSAAAAVSVIAGGWLSDRTGRRRPFIIVGNGALIGGNLLLLAWPTVPAVMVMAVLFGTGLGLSISCGRALASQVLPDQDAGAAVGLGTLSTAANVGQAIAPPIAALAIGLGGYPAVFLVSITGSLISLVAIALVRSVR
jgi:MFS family permease